jgi:hypothetical protein
MARFHTPTVEEEKCWQDWISGRPAAMREILHRIDPWTLYRLKPTGQRVTFRSVFEDGTLSVYVSAEFNALAFERSVFGIKLDDLEECDLPEAREPVGALLTDQEVGENIDLLRVTIRPDLWEMGPDGKAQRKNN